MKIAQGVNLHLIKTKQFKTNHITFRFSGDLTKRTIAKRVLAAQMLATVNASYPTARLFRQRLAALYGANLSTKVSTKGLVHIVDIDISFIRDEFTFNGEEILQNILIFLKECLFSPLAATAQYQPKIFDLEKKNLINYLEVDKEDSFYSSHLALKTLFFDNPSLQVSKYGQVDLVQAENSYTAYQEFQHMLNQDQIDIFVLGDFDDYKVVRLIHQFPFENRLKPLNFIYQQDYKNIITEVIEKRSVNQSVLQLAYHNPISYHDEDYFALLVFNGLFGNFPHSKLFTEIREKEGLAYTINSQINSLTGLLNVYAGIDKKNRDKTLKLINKQLSDIKLGRFSSTLVKQTKKMLITNRQAILDSPKATIEKVYNSKYLKENPDIDNWVNHINQVSKEDIIRVAGKIKLQVFYFLEGE